MPRIEIIPISYDPSDGDGSPTIDICACCAQTVAEGDETEHEGEPAVYGSTEVDHPPYIGEDWEEGYECEWCNSPLGDQDD